MRPHPHLREAEPQECPWDMHLDCRLVSILVDRERRYCASSLWNGQVSGRIVGLMSDSIFSCEDSCIDGRRVDNDFRRDRTNMLLLYMAVIPIALAMPLDPTQNGDRTDSSTPL